MEDGVLLRKLFQVVTIGVFIYQVQDSLQYYFDENIIQTVSHLQLKDVKQPDIYICEDQQLDYRQLREIGYQFMNTLLPGEISSSDRITWRGKNGNLTFSEIQNAVFKNDYSKLKTLQDRDEKIFVLPYGFCIKLSKSVYDTIENVKRSILLIDDPYKGNKLRMTELVNFNFGPTGKDTFDSSVIVVEYSLFDSSLQDGKTCKDYEKYNTTYGDCFISVLKTQLLELYDCLPPWFPDNTAIICEENIKRITVDNKTLMNKTKQDLDRIVEGRKIDASDKCMKPCKALKASYKKTLHITTRLDKTILTYEILDSVTVHTDMYESDLFDLVVDLGSALGLWLGMSALCIFDFMLIIYIKVIKKFID